MHRLKLQFAALLALAVTTSMSALAGSPESVEAEVAKCAALPEVVAAVEAQNTQGLTLEQIQQTDKAWTEAKGAVPLAQELQANPAAVALSACEKAQPYFKESILTDNQGANVAITEVTSDYWQGDEPKFAEAWANGAGKTFIARPKQDASAAETIAQISVPVMKDGKAIGTLTMGLRINQIP